MQQRDGIRVQLEKAREAREDGLYGADRWSQHQHKTLERVSQLIEILESSSTPTGSVIRLSNEQEFSPLKRELAARSGPTRLVSPSQSETPVYDELRLLLGADHG